MIKFDATLQDVRFFVAVYEERSFTAAAERENATQSGVSQHVRKLEDRFNVRLFYRDIGTVAPTPAGDMFYRRAIEVLNGLESATRDLHAFSSGVEGKITVGLMPTLTRCVLAQALLRFMQDNPNAVVQVVEAYSGLLTEKVSAGELDFAIVPGFSGAGGLKSSFFLNTPEVLVSRVESRFRHLAPVRLSEINPLNIVVSGSQNTRRGTLETYFVSSGVHAVRIVELDSMFATLDFVERTDWITILPGIMTIPEIGRHRLTLNPLCEPALTLNLVRIEPARRILSPVAEAFCGYLHTEASQMNAEWTETVPHIQPLV